MATTKTAPKSAAPSSPAAPPPQLKPPLEWAAQMFVQFIDTEGWRGPHRKTFDAPISAAEFAGRMIHSSHIRREPGKPVQESYLPGARERAERRRNLALIRAGMEQVMAGLATLEAMEAAATA